MELKSILMNKSLYQKSAFWLILFFGFAVFGFEFNLDCNPSFTHRKKKGKWNKNIPNALMKSINVKFKKLSWMVV